MMLIEEGDVNVVRWWGMMNDEWDVNVIWQWWTT